MASSAARFRRLGGPVILIACSGFLLFGVNLCDAQTPTTTVQEIGARTKDREDLSLLLDPNTTGWSTEAFSESAAKQLKTLAAMIERPDTLSREGMSALCAPDFACDILRPKTENAYQQDGIRVARDLFTPERKIVHCDVGSFQKRLTALRNCQDRPIRSTLDGRCHVKFKIVSVNAGPTKTSTSVYVEGNVHASEQSVHWRADWTIDWIEGADHRWLVRAIRVRDFEESRLAHPASTVGRWLDDFTASVCGSSRAYRDQLRYGMEHWVRRLESPLRINRLGHNGIAIADVNGDDRHDLYVCQAGGLPNRLFVGMEDGTVREIAAEAGVDCLDDSTCALFVDLDNDGDQDLTLMTVAGGFVFENNGKGRFTARRILEGCQNAFSLTASDYDMDGRLDLYVARYWPDADDRGDIPLPVPYYDATNGGANILYRNQGEFRFADVTASIGLNEDNTRFSMAAAWEDFDADGDSDLYVANDFGRNCLYRNDGGRFTNIAAEAGVEDAASGMSVTFGDYDRDGRTDIYVSNMFSSAGNRITYQRQYIERFEQDENKALQRMARGNTLFRNRGNGTFEDVSRVATVTMGRWAWGSQFADANNDGWEDLLVLNGNITSENSGDL